MDSYELFKFLHVAAAVTWVGSGLLLNIQGIRAERAANTFALRQVADDASALANVLFIPASMGTLLFGIITVMDGDLDFSLWIVLGLVGWAATFATGIGFLKPQGEKIERLLSADPGVVTPQAEIEIRRIFAVARIDYTVLYLVIFDMVVKPTGDDTGVLIVMAAAVALGIFAAVSKYRSIGEVPVSAA
jgi:hypothetical protein